MMKKLKFLTVLAVIIISFITCMPIKAYERNKHDELMYEVLFRNFKVVENDPRIADEINVLEAATYLTIDQFNGNGKKDYETLEKYGVKNLPSFEDIDISPVSPREHRTKTHRGWNHSSEFGMKETWPNRQNLLRNTMQKLFDFDGKESQKEAFCELIYYIHILGDHLADSSYKDCNGNNGLKMGVGGRKDKEDIIHELLDCFAVLFKDQTETHKYLNLTEKLRQYNSDYETIVQSEGGINTDEKFDEYKKLTDKVFNHLTLYVPEMLKEEEFFNKMFYK